MFTIVGPFRYFSIYILTKCGPLWVNLHSEMCLDTWIFQNNQKMLCYNSINGVTIIEIINAAESCYISKKTSRIS
jgi:hypothetical protein